MSKEQRAWTHEAIARIEADGARSADTHLLKFPLHVDWGIDLYLKDESVHPTGSLKHRLARSMFLHALCSGWIDRDTCLVEASSGSTAVSEAYFADLLSLPFVAVMPRSTSEEKVRLIERYGGRCLFVDEPAAIYEEARRVANARGGYYLDQFTYAERATDWRGNNNIAVSIFQQMSEEPHPVPHWIVIGAGTGGTSATLGRYVRYRHEFTRVCVVDPEGSAFYAAWSTGDPNASGAGSRIEGIGRPRVEPSFLPTVVDAMIRVPDAASIAAMRWCTDQLDRPVGGSTGTALWGALVLAAEMHADGQVGSIVTLIGDGGERYRSTYYDDAWVAAQGLDLTAYSRTLDELARAGIWKPPAET
jgi:cysteine synthase A